MIGDTMLIISVLLLFLLWYRNYIICAKLDAVVNHVSSCMYLSHGVAIRESAFITDY